ncbi:hypothetical protein [Halalkalibacterium ligniniphilum]|nr:hypothetical protein [Halalkalibacterium ligniniphilum]
MTRIKLFFDKEAGTNEFLLKIHPNVMIVAASQSLRKYPSLSAGGW